MDLEEFLNSYLYESDEARIDYLFSSIKMYLNEIRDVKSRVASIHLLIRKLRDLLKEYPNMT